MPSRSAVGSWRTGVDARLTAGGAALDPSETYAVSQLRSFKSSKPDGHDFCGDLPPYAQRPFRAVKTWANARTQLHFSLECANASVILRS